MKRSSRGWILLPVTVVLIVAVVVLVTSFQKESGLSNASKGGVAAVAAASAARELASGDGPAAFAAYGDAYLTALVARNNAPAFNAADTRLDHVLLEILDCLSASREAWLAQLENTWDPSSQGLPAYWRAMHPSLQTSGSSTLTPGDIRRISAERASLLLDQALSLAS